MTPANPAASKSTPHVSAWRGRPGRRSRATAGHPVTAIGPGRAHDQRGPGAQPVGRDCDQGHQLLDGRPVDDPAQDQPTEGARAPGRHPLGRLSQRDGVTVGAGRPHRVGPGVDPLDLDPGGGQGAEEGPGAALGVEHRPVGPGGRHPGGDRLDQGPEVGRLDRLPEPVDRRPSALGVGLERLHPGGQEAEGLDRRLEAPTDGGPRPLGHLGRDLGDPAVHPGLDPGHHVAQGEPAEQAALDRGLGGRPGARAPGQGRRDTAPEGLLQPGEGAAEVPPQAALGGQAPEGRPQLVTETGAAGPNGPIRVGGHGPACYRPPPAPSRCCTNHRRGLVTMCAEGKRRRPGSIVRGRQRKGGSPMARAADFARPAIRRLTRLTAGLVVAGSGLALVSAATTQPAGAVGPFTLAWSQTLSDAGGPVAQSSPMIANLPGGPAVVVGDTSGNVWAYYLNGSGPVPGWPYRTGGVPVSSTPSVAPTSGSGPDSVFVGLGNASNPSLGGYQAISPGGGDLWFHQVTNPLTDPLGSYTAIAASMAVGNLEGGTDVIAPSTGQNTYAFNAASGAVLPGWPRFQGDSDFATPALADLYRSGQTEIVDAADSSPGLAYNRTYPQGGILRVLQPTGTLVNPNDPAAGEVCEYDTTQSLESSAAVGEFLGASQNVAIVFGTSDYFAGASDTNKVIAVSASCNFLWSATLNGVTADSPALADVLGNGQLQVVEGTDIGDAHSSGTVYVLDGATGHVVWSAPAAGAVIGSITTADLTGDGHQDLLVPTTGGVQVFDGRTGQLLTPTPLGQYQAFQSPPAGHKRRQRDARDHHRRLQQRQPGGHRPLRGGPAGRRERRRGRGVAHVPPRPAADRRRRDGDQPPGAVQGAGHHPGRLLHGRVRRRGLQLRQPPVLRFDRGDHPQSADRGPGRHGHGRGLLDGGPRRRRLRLRRRRFVRLGARRRGPSVTDVVGMVATRDGHGYLMIGRDGGIFAFGDANFYGSLPGAGVHVSNVVGIVPTADGQGYWMVGSDGGVFAFGDAGFVGSLPGVGVHVGEHRRRRADVRRPRATGWSGPTAGCSPSATPASSGRCPGSAST